MLNNIDLIKPYILPDMKEWIPFIQEDVGKRGAEGQLDLQLKYLDCSRISNSGMRLMQTIGYPYQKEMSFAVYIIHNYIDKNKQDEWYNKLIERHSANIEYERINPPVVYDKKNGIKKPSTRKTKKETSKEPKISAAEKKLKAAAVRLNKLSIKLTPKIST